MTTPRDRDVLTIPGWPGGVNNRARETENITVDNRLNIPTGEFLREAKNVDLTAQGKPLRRRGYSRVLSGFSHSLWRSGGMPFSLVVYEGSLCSLVGPDLVRTVLKTVDMSRPMSYTTVNDRVFFSNGIDKGSVDFSGTLREWGLPTPPAPLLAATAGAGLNAGQYQVAVTYVGADGEESGATEPVTITVTQGAGFSVTLPAAPPEAAATRVYVTQADSEVFYRYYTGPSGASVAVGIAGLGSGPVLETQHLESVIPGDIIRHYNGRIYFSVGSAIFFTEALRYGLVRYSQAVYMMPQDITLLEPVQGGIYVGYGDTVVFLSGDDPYAMNSTRVNSQGAVADTGTAVPGRFVEQNLDYVPVWWSQAGGMEVGLPGGEIRQLTQDRLAVPDFSSGAILAREKEGMRHLVSVLKQPGENALGASDSVVAEIRRNALKT